MNESPYKPLLVRRWVLLMLMLLAVPLAILVAGIVRVVVAEVDYLGSGASAGAFDFLFGALAFWFMAAVPYYAWRDGATHTPWWTFGRQAAIWLGVLPASMLLGRVAFSYIPPWDPLIGCIFMPVVAYYFLKDIGMPVAGGTDPEYRRGARQLSLAEATASAAALPPSDDPPIRWAGFDLPAFVSEGHFCVVGAPGAGKTLMMRTLMASVLPHIKPGTDRRAIVYDVKLDAISHLQDMGLSCPPRILNPFDTRCVAWDMAADLTDPDGADQYAAILVPAKRGEHNSFFTDAARSLVGGALKAFIIGRLPWTLRDLIHVTANETRLRQVLESSPYTSDLISRYFEPKNTFRNILSTVANAMVRLESVAAIWHALPPDRHFSINRWCTDECSVIVLGRQFDRRETLTLLNQIIFRRLSELLLSRHESPTKWSAWFFIDELKEGGQLDGLPELLTNGRSKGVRVALGFQDIEGLRDTYGEHIANEMPGMCANRSILHLRSSFTAQWASDQLGEVEKFEYVTNFGTSRDKDGNLTRSENTTKQIEARRAILPSEFTSFAISMFGQVYGCHIVPALKGFVSRVTEHTFHTARPLDNFSPRTNPAEMLLPGWTSEDDRRLKLSPPSDGPDTKPVRKKPPGGSPLDGITRLTGKKDRPRENTDG